MISLVACGSDAVAEPTPTTPATQTSTAEPQSTEMVESTSEPVPTNTALPAPTNTPLPDAVYLDETQPIEARVEDLLGRMTLAEKIGQMTLIQNHSIKPEAVTDFKLGAMLSGGGGGPQGTDDNSAEAWREMVIGYQTAALETRLRIPLLYGVDAVHGHSNVSGATLFPHNVGLGATGNPELLFEIGRATALETLATSIHWDYAPVLAVSRDVRWGRAYEAYGEDTKLVTDLSLAYMLGLQSVDGVSDLGNANTLLATPKHWVGDGGTVWGSSTTSNYAIDQGDTQLDEATLREVHIAPYIPAIEQGAMSIMVSYSSWNGEKMHGQKYLITDVLKEELGFNGFVVSDWQAIDQIDSSYDQAVIRSINAGVDMSMEPFDARKFIRVLTKAVDDGDVSQARIDDAVRRILRAKFALGLFEQPTTDDSLLATVGSDAHRTLARQAVRESLVLLKNADAALPLSNEARTVFIAGQHADDLGLQSGGWSIEWQGKSGDITEGTTILEAVTEVLGDSAE
ncbi:MAG: glycoside hydrolase family 3 N-terminal domain-containing protein, partial [Candidatus Promineifilaceae bacterium]